ncbi:MAG: glycosyltransferase family 2 protein [Ignavibacteria bacterium]|nr:glycosyltransferase family 2 protein [Ignavibacteria bacterium]
MKKAITAIVPTYNEEKNLARCLSSLRWCDELIVIDSFSTDNSVKIAESFGAKVLINNYISYSHQVVFGVEHAANDWILIVDADEEVSDNLKNEIEEVLNQNSNKFFVYEIPRKVFFLGRWIEHCGWFPDFQIRFFHRDYVIINLQQVHGGFIPKTETKKLNGLVYHYSYKNIFEYINKMNWYTSNVIADRIKSGKKSKSNWYNLILNPISNFIRIYFVRKGYKDGIQGLVLSICDTIYNLVLYMKLWEYNHAKSKNLDLPPTTNEELRQSGYTFREKNE